MLVLIIALLFPIIYFLNDFIKNSKTNFISILGFVNILLTGLIGILGEKFGISKNWFKGNKRNNYSISDRYFNFSFYEL